MGIKEILQVISAVFKAPKQPLTSLPPPLVLTGGNMRPGLSPDMIAARIITRQSEAGANVGPLPDGSESISEKMERIRIQEIVKAIMTEAKIEVVIPPGVAVTAVGGNAGGPVTVAGATTNYASGVAVIR